MGGEVGVRMKGWTGGCDGWCVMASGCEVVGVDR